MRWPFGRRARDIDDEIRSHLQMAEADRADRGETPDEARRRARKEFGNAGLVAEVTREMSRWTIADRLSQDLRHTSQAIRRLAREPGFTIVAVLVLAVGIGASTAMFSVVHAVLLQPFGVTAPDRVVVSWPEFRGVGGEYSFRQERDVLDRIDAFDGSAVFGSVNWSGILRLPGAEPVRLSESAVSWRFFDVLGARPLVGRTFRAEDDLPTSPRLIVLSHGAWIGRFGGDPAIIGRRVDIDGPAEILGVMPPEFFFPRGAEYWTNAGPLLAGLALARNEPVEPLYEGLNVFFAVSRLDPGAGIAVAREQAGPALRALGERYKVDTSAMGIAAMPLADHIFGPARRGLIALMGAVAVVLLVACVNVAGLLLARGAARARETAVRTALGASRLALARLFVIEAGVLATAGAVLGVSVAALTLDALVALSPADVPRLDSVSIDRTVLLFAVGLTMATTLVLSLASLVRLAGRSVADTLRGAATGVAGRSGTVRARSLLVGLQSAATVMLLIAAGLCIESFGRLSRLDLGFDPTNVLTFSIGGLTTERYPTKAQRDDAVTAILEHIERSPGVLAAGAVYLRPFQHRSIGMDARFWLEGQPPQAADTNPLAIWEAATPGYFDAMGIRLLRGRNFDATDTSTSPRVVIVSDAMASRMWPGEDAIGKRLRLVGVPDIAGMDAWYTVVGIAETARYREIETPRLDLYVPYRDAEAQVQHFMVRSSGDPTSLVPALNDALRSFDTGLRLDGVTTMEAIVRRTRGPWHFNMLVFSLFGTTALALAALGLFGLVAYAVAQRRREIGVRMALGATRVNVVGLMIAQGVRPAVIGLALGISAAFYATRALSGLLFETSPTDPATFLRMPLVLVVVTVLASAWPARRAASIDPAVVLRQE